MIDWVIWGNGGHALVVDEIIREAGGRVIAMIDRDAGESMIPDAPLLVGEGGLAAWRSAHAGPLRGIAAVGGRGGRDRMAIHRVFRDHGIDPTSVISERSHVSRSAVIGPGTHILAGAVLGPRAHLGEGCILNHRVSVDHESRLGNGVHVSPGATVCGLVEVEDFVWIGAGATVIPRIRIGQGAIVGAGAVVTSDVPAGVTVVGVPARPVTPR